MDACNVPRRMSRRQSLRAGPRPERETTQAFILRQMFDHRLHSCDIVVSKGHTPSRELVEQNERKVWVAVDAGGVVGRILIYNAISRTEESAILRWVDEGWDQDCWREYRGKGIDFGAEREADAKGTVERIDVATVPYKLEGEADVRATVFNDGTRFASALLDVVSRRVHDVLDRAKNAPEWCGDESDTTDAPNCEPSLAIKELDFARGAADPVHDRIDRVAQYLRDTWNQPEALQVTRYHSDRMSSLAQHFDSRACYGAIATASLRYCCTLVMVRKGRGFEQVSRIPLYPRSVYILTGSARGDCTDPDDSTRNHVRCSCCWTHGIQVDTDDDFCLRFDKSANARRRVGLTIRSLTPATLQQVTLDLERAFGRQKRRRADNTPENSLQTALT